MVSAASAPRARDSIYAIFAKSDSRLAFCTSDKNAFDLSNCAHRMHFQQFCLLASAHCMDLDGSFCCADAVVARTAFHIPFSFTRSIADRRSFTAPVRPLQFHAQHTNNQINKLAHIVKCIDRISKWIRWMSVCAFTMCSPSIEQWKWPIFAFFQLGHCVCVLSAISCGCANAFSPIGKQSVTRVWPRHISP